MAVGYEHCSASFTTEITLATASKLMVNHSTLELRASQEITTSITETIKVDFKHKTSNDVLATKSITVIVDTTCAEADLVSETFSVTYPDDVESND